MRDFRFHPLASEELDEAIGFYELRERGLGLDLESEVQVGLIEIQMRPTAGPYAVMAPDAIFCTDFHSPDLFGNSQPIVDRGSGSLLTKTGLLEVKNAPDLNKRLRLNLDLA